MKKNVNIVTDPDGRKLVMINDICFRAKRREEWEEVERYLKEYVGECVLNPHVVYTVVTQNNIY